MSQNKRESTLKQFRDGRISVLVATDIAARGLDVPSISQVVNYDLPLSAADYVHRIGRTGRAGSSGIALSFVSDDQRFLVRDIEKVTGRSLDPDSPFSATRNDSKGPRQSRNRRSSGINGGRNSNVLMLVATDHNQKVAEGPLPKLAISVRNSLVNSTQLARKEVNKHRRMKASVAVSNHRRMRVRVRSPQNVHARARRRNPLLQIEQRSVFRKAAPA